MKKGFTLIELLAVILILGIIALIAIPAVTNVIEDSKKHSAEVSALHYVQAINDQNALYKLQPDKFTPITSGNVENIEVNIKGDLPKEGTVTIENGKVTEAEFCIGGYEVTIQGHSLIVGHKCGSTEPTCTGEDQTFEFTNNVQTYTVTCTGTYKLEVWGAEGGSYDTTYYGGKGGYSEGTIRLTSNTTLYVVVGGQGAKYNGTVESGGYNGGGGATVTNSSYGKGATGGGATHIATASGELKDLSDNKSSVLIVAGGGGGGGRETTGAGGYVKGGAGGGTEGKTGTTNRCNAGTGGTQTTGFEFGTGGLGSQWAGSGGGGYYGGVAYGGGGSGYIGGVTNGQSIDGDSSMPTHDGTSTMTGNTGNGYAKITFIGN